MERDEHVSQRGITGLHVQPIFCLKQKKPDCLSVVAP
jgi:hypothetical protein